MTAKKPPSKLVTEDEKRQAINVAIQKLFVQLGLSPDLFEAKIRFGLHSELTAEQQQKMAMVKGLQLAVDPFMDQLLPDIRTQEDLDNALIALNTAAERGPTEARKVMDQIRAGLPRQGGPGRIPKLNAQESSKVCDQIAQFIRQKHTLKQALAKTSALCPTLLGKKVSARTLQNAWGKRDEFNDS